MRFYFEKGYPTQSVIEYLLNIINSGFEIWRAKNPDAHWTEFKFGVNDITTVAPIFDLVKLNDISKNIIAKMSAEEVYENVLCWAEEYDKAFASYLKDNKKYCTSVFGIGRDAVKPRKDIYIWSMAKEEFSYMFNSPNLDELLPEDRENYLEFIDEYAKNFVFPKSKEEWFENVKVVAQKLNYQTDNKLYKANPSLYKGNTAKACEFVRLALTGKRNSPDLYEIMTVLGEKESFERIKNNRQ